MTSDAKFGSDDDETKANSSKTGASASAPTAQIETKATNSSMTGASASVPTSQIETKATNSSKTDASASAPTADGTKKRKLADGMHQNSDVVVKIGDDASGSGVDTNSGSLTTQRAIVAQGKGVVIAIT